MKHEYTRLVLPWIRIMFHCIHYWQFLPHSIRHSKISSSESTSFYAIFFFFFSFFPPAVGSWYTPPPPPFPFLHPRGRIHKHLKKPSARLKKGDEIGMFKFGGSSIMVAFERNRIKFDHDLVYHSHRSVEVNVEMGMSLGKATIPGGNREPVGYTG